MFKEIFVQLLQKRDITAYKLAKDTGISEALISNWKTGRQLPRYDSIILLCNYFNISADYLLGRIDVNLSNDSFKEDSAKKSDIISFEDYLNQSSTLATSTIMFRDGKTEKTHTILTDKQVNIANELFGLQDEDMSFNEFLDVLCSTNTNNVISITIKNENKEISRDLSEKEIKKLKKILTVIAILDND